MNSFDIFDTLIGRWYMSPESIFAEIELELQIPNFVWLRKHSENIANHKTLDVIYLAMATVGGLSEESLRQAKEMEFDLECRRSFPIKENIAKLTPDCLLISDTYFSPEQLSIILDVNGITKSMYKDILCSYDGKASRRIWGVVKPDHHFGDNLTSDYLGPQDYGIKTTHYTGQLLSPTEFELTNRFGFHKLAYFSRMMRLLNPYSVDSYHEVWNEQAEINIPLLILLSHQLNSYLSIYGKLLFTQRDCANLYEIFTNLYPDTNVKPLYSSRQLYENPTPAFIEYMKKEIDQSTLIVDMQGTGKTCLGFFQKHMDKPLHYFPIVYSDLDNTFATAGNILYRKDGFTDKIEKLNYINLGRVIGVEDDLQTPIRDVVTKNEFVDAQKNAIDTALTYMQRGFNLTLEHQPILPAIRFLLEKVEEDCSICKYVNHEGM